MQPAPASLKPYNALRLDSVADHCLHITETSQFLPALEWAAERRLPVTVLGGGTNVLLWPHLSGLTLRVATTGIEVIEDDGRFVTLRVAAGENWHSLVTWCHNMGYHGLANLAWIPGSVGAVPVQNVGAYGVEVEAFIVAVHTLDKTTGASRVLSHSQCGFGYRDSIFRREPGRHFLITAVDFRLDRGADVKADYPALRQALGDGAVTHQRVFDAVIQVRQQRLPDHRVVPNVGSFFKNPSVNWMNAEIFSMRWPQMPQFPAGEGRIKLSAAWMIDHLGWRGREAHDVAVDPNHALILVNRGATEVHAFLSLADDIIADVEKTFEITLEREPLLLGAGGVR